MVGSGVAAIACAQALIERGVQPVILDAGEELDRDRQARINRLAGQDRSDWSGIDVDALKPRRGSGIGAIPRKLAFGSDYVYGHERAHSPLDCADGVIPPTYARGGYSTVWGAAVLPAHDSDLAGWPVRRADLAPHYRAVLRGRPLSGAADVLSDEFPLYSDSVSAVAPSPQGRALLGKLQAGAEALRADQIWAGRSRLLVAAEGAQRCIECGLCLTGCPRSAIHCSDGDLRRWLAAGAVEYRPQTVVRSVAEDADGVRVFLDRGGEERFDRVFLGAGALNTTRIVLRARALYDRPVHLCDSQKFLVPFVLRRRVPGALTHPGNVLANAFIEIRDTVDGHWVHIQMSPHNELVEQSLRLRRGPLAAVARRALAPVFERVMYAWGSLHSDSSGALQAALRPRRDGEPLLEIRSVPNANSRVAAARAIGKLARHARELGGAPFVPLLRMSKVGGSAHYGGSLPMVAGTPAELQSDLLGRPWGFARVHCIDAAVLPSIPGTTVALTVMANAHRIASVAMSAAA